MNATVPSTIRRSELNQLRDENEQLRGRNAFLESENQKYLRDVLSLEENQRNAERLLGRQKDQLKICRGRMRAAGIGEQYPGCNPDAEERKKTEITSSDYRDMYYYLKEMKFVQELELQAEHQYTDLLLGHIAYLRMKLIDQADELNPIPERPRPEVAQRLFEEFLEEDNEEAGKEEQRKIEGQS